MCYTSKVNCKRNYGSKKLFQIHQIKGGKLMSEKVMTISIPEGSKCRKVEVTDDGSIVELFLLEDEDSTIEVTKRPAEGKWFDIDPLAIDQKLFEKKRNDSEQETTRKLILEAFTLVKENPEKYGKPFQTMIPKKTWKFIKTRRERIEIFESIFSDYSSADWVHQSLEWAQRIANGESWESICNEGDMTDYYRLVVWKQGWYERIGGSFKCFSLRPASYIHYIFFFFLPSISDLNSSVPLLMRLKK